MTIALGCDEVGFLLKESIKKFLDAKGVDIEDYGV